MKNPAFLMFISGYNCCVAFNRCFISMLLCLFFLCSHRFSFLSCFFSCFFPQAMIVLMFSCVLAFPAQFKFTHVRWTCVMNLKCTSVHG